MAATNQPHSSATDRRRTDTDYTSCLITPMGRDGEPLVQARHLIDAVLVGLLVFFAVILGDALTALAQGRFVYLSGAEIAARTPTGLVAFGLTFVFQFLRARGLDVLDAYYRFKESLP